MKTTLDIPDPLFREAKMVAAREGTTLRAVVTRALRSELQRSTVAGEGRPAWARTFGGLRDLRSDTDVVNGAIEEAFGQIDPADWQ